MKNRSDIRDFIIHLEHSFPVNTWVMNDVHIWPYVRQRLFFHLIEELESQEKNVSTLDVKEEIVSIKKNTINTRIRDVLRYVKFIANLEKKEYLFLGANTYRTLHEGTLYNKYFDSFIEKENLLEKSILFEYDTDNHTNYHNREIIQKYKYIVNGFSILNRFKSLFKIQRKNELDDFFTQFIYFLNEKPITKSFVDTRLNNTFFKELENLFNKKDLFEKIFLKIKPHTVIVLCYYSNLDSLAAVIAANRLGIKTVELQHGPQTDIHLCYGSWTKIPKEGYEMIPKNFWCWDEDSEETIRKWANNTCVKTKIIGNPWCEYWKARSLNYSNTNFILYTLQPEPLSFEQLFPEGIIRLIRKESYTWYVRLHPRQLLIIDEFIEFCKSNNIYHLINLESATNDSLPLLLANCSLHLTHFSGSTIEASFFNKKTILINESGKVSYNHLIKDNRAFFIPYDDDHIEDKLNELIKRLM
ncbi:hypothetical protein ACFO3O_20405 [Dokdonia ponticola]|uniref:Capsule polysaccharide biosynthesis protein n=1 Tax=Dokdonia ponticola TaxID=2041041 RepID=A0ABV9I3K7_9FLAO